MGVLARMQGQGGERSEIEQISRVENGEAKFEWRTEVEKRCGCRRGEDKKMDLKGGKDVRLLLGHFRCKEGEACRRDLDKR